MMRGYAVGKQRRLGLPCKGLSAMPLRKLMKIAHGLVDVAMELASACDKKGEAR